MNCPGPNCPNHTSVIFCGPCWSKLPSDMKARLIWLHPDVAKTRKVPVKVGAYDALLGTAVGHLKYLSD